MIQDYINEKCCIYQLPINISKYITLLGLKRKSKEERKTNRYKSTYLKAIQIKYGENITNVSQVAEVQKKKEETINNHYGSYQEYFSKWKQKGFEQFLNLLKDVKWKEELILKQKTSIINKYGVNNPIMIPEAKEKALNSRKNYLDNMTIDEKRKMTEIARSKIKHRGGYSSNIEKIIQKQLIDMNILFETNKMKWSFSWDIILKHYPIIIEIQGDYWHGNPNIYKETDLIMGKILVRDIWKKDQRKLLKSCEMNYYLITIWETEIRNCKSEQDLKIMIFNKFKEINYEYIFDNG